MGYENSGRRPQPTALRMLRGNPGKKKANKNEPRPPAGEVQKPRGLSRAATAVWEELAPICIAMGTLTVADVRPFATLCELQATLQRASAQKDEERYAPFTTKVEDSSDEHSPVVVVVDAVLKLERDTANALRPYYALFGLEPISRARIQVPKPEKPASKWAGVLS